MDGKINEEEIKEILQEFLKLKEIHSSNNTLTKSFLTIYQEAVQGLLTLYNEAKEKNKMYKLDMDFYTINGLIPKRKIKEKIKEAEEYLDNAKENSTVKEYELVIEFLEELLEE